MSKREVQTRPLSFMHFGITALIAAIVAAWGCGNQKGTPLDKTSSAPAVGSPTHGGGQPAAGQDGATGTGPVAQQGEPAASGEVPPPNALSCPLNREVKNAAPDSAEAVVAALFAAASGPDDEASFTAFSRHFGNEHNRDWVRKQYWPRARQHVSKYLSSTKPLTYYICREDKQSTGAVKYFIRSFEPQKSDPPITLRQDGGKWVVEFYTP